MPLEDAIAGRAGVRSFARKWRNVCAGISGLSIVSVFRGALPFLLANLQVLILICLIPELSSWLPTLIMC